MRLTMSCYSDHRLCTTAADSVCLQSATELPSCMEARAPNSMMRCQSVLNVAPRSGWRAGHSINIWKYHSTIPQFKEHGDAVVQACMSAVLLFALQSHHIPHQQTPSIRNVLRVRLLLKPHLLSASSFSINGEYSVADDLGPYLHNTGQAELVQFTT